MHLDRDDLGRANDVVRVGGQAIVNALNQETVSIRGIVAGEYVVNMHLYRAVSTAPIPVTVKVEKLNPRVVLVFYGTIELDRQGQEETAARFTVAGDGAIRDVNKLAKSLVPLRPAPRVEGAAP